MTVAMRKPGGWGLCPATRAKRLQGAGPTRIAQGRRVGGLEPKLHSLGVDGYGFGGERSMSYSVLSVVSKGVTILPFIGHF